MPNHKFYSAAINPGEDDAERISLNATDEEFHIVAQCYGSYETTLNLSSFEGFDIAVETLRQKIAKDDLDDEACHTAEVQTHRNINIVTRLVVNQDGAMYVHLIDDETEEYLSTIGGFTWVQFDAAYTEISKQYFAEAE